MPGDYEYLYGLETGSPTATRWRFGTATVSTESYVHLLWQGVVANLLVTSLEAGGAPVGLATIYGADPVSRTAHFAILGEQEEFRTGRLIEGLALLLQHGFSSWGYRKLYAEVLGPNLGQFESAVGTYCEIEGRLRSHSLVDGRYVDKYLLAVYAEVWSAVWDSYGSFVAAKPADDRAWDAQPVAERLARAHDELARWLPPGQGEGTAMDDDLALDPIEHSRLVVALQALTGRALPPGAAAEVRTRRDVYAVVVSADHASSLPS